METVWELHEGAESYGSLRGGIGREKVRFQFELTKGGFFYFVCSLPYALNQKGSTTFERFKVQRYGLLRRWGVGRYSRFSVDVRVKVFNRYTNVFEKSFVLDIANKQEAFDCFEVMSGFVPVTVEVELEGHSFLKKLVPAASLHRYGSAPTNPAEKAIVARMGKFLMASTMNRGANDYDQLMRAERRQLMEDTNDFGIFRSTSISSVGSIHSPAGGSVGFGSPLGGPIASPPLPPLPALTRTLSMGSTRSSHSKSSGGLTNIPSIFEVQSDDAIGDAMFYLLDKGILSAPVWDEPTQTYLGMFDIQDAMHFTLKLREMSKLSKSSQRRGDFLIYGITVGETESSSWFGLDLPVSIFFREENTRIAPWVPLTIATPMKRVLKALIHEAKRIPVVDRSGKVIKVISQSEIINQVFHRFIQPKLNPAKRDYFNTTHLNEAAVTRGIKIFHLDDSIFGAFTALMASTKWDALPVVDDDGKLIATLTPVDSWFLCKTELEEENGPLEVGSLTIRDFLAQANHLAEEHLAKKRKEAVAITRTTPLSETISKLVQYKVHGVYVVDEQKHPIGRINVADIVRALLEDDVGIFKRVENIADVFFWERERQMDPHRPTVDDAVRRAALRCAKRRGNRGSASEPNSAATPNGKPASDIPHHDEDDAHRHGLDSDGSSEAGGHDVQLRRQGHMNPLGTIALARRASSGYMSKEAAAIAQARGLEASRRLAHFCPTTPDSVLGLEEQSALEQHLPRALHLSKWICAFHMRRDGASALALREQMRNDNVPAIFALEDHLGYRFGGFCPSGLFLDRFANEEAFNEGPAGDGESFVFSFGHKSAPALKVYPWTGKNRYFRLISARRGFAMGGGATGFAFIVDDLLQMGSSSHSETFDNECLASSPEFRCINLEVLQLTPSLHR